MQKRKKIIMGMSGGVDSSVAAAILVEKGYEVIGVFINNDYNSIQAIKDAKKVSENLGIELNVIDCHNEFKKKIIDYFIDEYLEGRTPNPCVICNRHIKFEILLDQGAYFKADYIATGHYAKIEYSNEKKRYLLKKAQDHTKDQTYMLYRLSQEQLGKVMFPLGEYDKDEVRDLALKYKLPVASKPDSQEICFVAHKNYSKFILEHMSKEIDKKNLIGDFVDTKGNIIGRHKGIIHYTVGQRRGLGIALGRPVYVVRINKKRNQVVLGDLEDLMSKTIFVGDLNFISIQGVNNYINGLRVNAKIRYAAKEAAATIYPFGATIKLEFDCLQKAATPGQSAVFYDKETVVGGGIITEG